MRRSSAGAAFGAALFLLTALAPGRAQTVEVVPAVDSAGQAAGTASLVAVGCMRTLFEGGCIVSDERPRTLSAPEWENIALGVKEAEEGFADLVFTFHIEMQPSRTVAGGLWPASIRYRVVRVADLEVVLEGGLSPPAEDARIYRQYDAVMDGLGVSIGKAFLAAASRIGLAAGVKPESACLGGYL